jgi:hypothetical protein
MQINLGGKEVTALLSVLDLYIPQLREEISKTDNYDMRQDLSGQEQTLSSLVIKLGGKASSLHDSDLGAENPPWG